MHGEGGAIFYDTIQIGTLGAWRLSATEGGAASFTATGCTIAAFWTSAGVARLCARPHANGMPKLWSVEGEVGGLTDSTFVLTNIHIIQEGAATT
jgi:hypothetical protein